MVPYISRHPTHTLLHSRHIILFPRSTYISYVGASRPPSTFTLGRIATDSPQMTDTNTDTPAAAVPEQTTNTTKTTSTTTSNKRNKNKLKLRRKARRRDGADSDDDDDAGSASDASSASSSAAKPSKASASKAKPKPAASPATASAKPATEPLFPDVNSTTPAAWADMTDKGDEITFDEFSRGDAARGRGGAVRGGRGRGGKAVPREPRELTEEQKRREEEKRVHKREKLKAKRKAKKEAEMQSKAASKAAASSAPSAPAPGPSAAPSSAGPAVSTPAEEADSSLAASTSALTLDDPTPTSESSSAPTPASATDGPGARPGPVPRNRVAYTQRVAEDPKFTPRVGNFWMHDQRHYEAGSIGEGSFSGLRGMSDYWRGRGGMRGMPRGGFRGAPIPRGRGRGRGFGFVPPVRQMSPAPAPAPAPAAAAAAAAAPAPVAANGPRMAEMDKLEMELSQKAQNQRQASSEGKWGHEGFEEFTANEDNMRAHRIVRGRGRGRGFARGGPLLRPIPRSVAHLPTPEASPDRSASAKVAPEHTTTTQPTVDTLLEDSGSVTVKLPGGKSIDVDRPPSQPTESAELAKGPFPPVFTPSNPSPVPYVGSDSGSMSSGYIPAAPVVPVHTGQGDFYMPNAGMGAPPPNFRPHGGPGAPGFYPGNYRPQSFTPEPHFNPHHQQRGSFSGPAQAFYPNAVAAQPRPGSPLNPYAGQMGFFVPPRPNQKVPIRSPPHGNANGTPAEDGGAKSPVSDGVDSSMSHGAADGFVPGYYQQYNPYAPGADGQPVFYPQGYWPQAGYEGGDYAYGDVQYHGY